MFTLESTNCRGILGTEGDVLPKLTQQIAQQTQLICFDEFQITDIADAAILSRLFGGLWERGVVTVSTSNRTPEDLYRGGLNWKTYIPGFVAILQKYCVVRVLDSGCDYRELHGSTSADVPTFVAPLGPVASTAIEQAFETLSCTPFDAAESQDVAVMMGRSLHVPRAANKVAFFRFNELCEGALGAADYLALAAQYHTVILDGVPCLGSHNPDVTRRFMTLVDVLYDHSVRLLCAAEVEPSQLFAGNVSSRVEKNSSLRTNDRLEMTLASNAASHEESIEMWVDTTGGSSGRNTTMVGNAEWSATGLKGVSLGAYMGTSDIEFSKARTISRLLEMGSARYVLMHRDTHGVALPSSTQPKKTLMV